MKNELEYLSKRVADRKLSRRDFMGRASALGVSAAAASTMLSSAALAAGPKKGGTMKLGMMGGESTNTLDPAPAATQVPGMNLRLYGDQMVDVAADGSVEMRLAESVESTPDAKTWHFKVRQGVEFHNGKTVTSEDFLRTVERHANEDSKSGALGVLQGIKDMRAEGDTFTVEMENPTADLPYLMADWHLVVQPDGGFDNPNAGIGTGPYTIEVDEPGVRHAFKKNPNYWDDTRGHVDEVELLVINDNTARMSALQSGQVHMVNGVDPKVASLLNRAPNLEVRNVAGRAHYVFVMHGNTAPFDNKDLRLALKYAINREELVEKVLRGFGSVGNDMPINAAYPFFDDSFEQRMYDPEKAAEHYKASGHDGSPIVLHVSDAAFAGAVDAAQLFQQSAAAAGIPLEIKREPSDGYWSEVWNAKPFCASYWSGRPVQDQMYTTAYHSQADWNDTRFNNAEFDDLLIKARGELDPAKRKEMYSRMGHLVRDESGLIAPMFNDFVDGVSKQVVGYEDDPNGFLMYSWAPIKCWLDA
ncbi:peptide/nickel transport system substrate-binding protein [Aliiroseovarius halocynthiae]|uniref:Twin-arginine translocation signal domain-containing protein n=1 Tax=Aliiroseovarius halocynthiae TaxID=985055 RepID=A0A545SM15_9RHOB|nr:ABC transporter substrate-binding protein [Aliiroseovarius halocynthiae]TQV65886.1 twin-arginine translocation signal domain-containing protein [Aliiroseovarius halocynthiae]SMR83483.1 peptide/nickel transport system substrate-binding protein [Aliiroseovarius halocynthiae]